MVVSLTAMCRFVRWFSSGNIVDMNFLKGDGHILIFEFLEEWFIETCVNWDYFWFCMDGKFLSIMIIFWLIIYIGWRHK